MYLSKITLGLRSPSVRQGLRNCADMHRNIQRCFGTDRSDSGVLYRLHKTENGCCIYLLSETAPKRMASGMTLAGCRDMTDFEDSMTAGRVFRFDLLCMPCKKIPDGIGRNSRRVNLRTPEEKADWVMRKAAVAGFEILPDSLNEMREIVIMGERENSPLYFHATQFAGVLRITDEAAFRKAWREGIGPEKAYGLGMLMLMRI